MCIQQRLFSDTKFYRCWFRDFFRYQIFLIPALVPLEKIKNSHYKISSTTKFFQNRFQDFFPLPNFSDTSSETFIQYQNFLDTGYETFSGNIMTNSWYQKFPSGKSSKIFYTISTNSNINYTLCLKAARQLCEFKDQLCFEEEVLAF